MNKEFLLGIILLLLPVTMAAQNWDAIRTSGEYYYGVGVGATQEEATKMAMEELVSSIVTHVSSDFSQLTNETNINGTIDHKTQVRNCVNTYSQATLRNVEKWPPIGKAPEITVRCYMKKTELFHIYEDRIAKAKDMVMIANEALAKNKIDMALEYYYWAYSLIRSIQRPSEVKDEQGHILVNWIPIRIDEILSDIKVAFDSRDGDYVNLSFTYRGEPVNSLEFTYNDGRSSDCVGRVNDGRGMMDLIPDYDKDSYHLFIEYEYKSQARGDDEMRSVMDVISSRVFPKAAVVVKAPRKKTDNTLQASTKTSQTENTSAYAAEESVPPMKLEPSTTIMPDETQAVDNNDEYVKQMSTVINAIQKRNYGAANRCFTIDGLEMYNKLITYGTGRIVGNPSVSFFKGLNGEVIARGLQMSFSFKSGRKKTYVEDVVFTFNADKKIDNVAFGLGRIAENDLLTRQETAGWGNEARELLTSFLENYKTAYCLKRLDYIRDVFADDARIIVGNVLKHQQKPRPGQERQISIEGEEIIRYNRYTKDEYLNQLAQTFSRSEFINIRFSRNEVQWLTKFKDKKVFAIQIGQEYDSSRYADKGYLFLLVDLTDESLPQIYVRSWQPNEVSMDKLYNAGDFSNFE